jgi:hypothetical protein
VGIHVYNSHIKAGKWPLADIKSLSGELFVRAKEARDRSTLPDEPERDKAEQLLVSIAKSSIKETKL